MSTFGPTQIEVEDPSTNGDLSVGVGDTCSINSDVSSSTHMENSYSIIHSQAVSTVPPAVVYATSRSSRFFGPLLCCVRRRRKPKDSAKHPSSSSYQAELDIHECIARLEEKIKSCQDKKHAKQLSKELKEIVENFKKFLVQLQIIMDQGSDMVNVHRENQQQLVLTLSTSEKLLIQLSEKEEEIRALREEHNKRLQQLRELEDEKQSHQEHAKILETDYCVEVEQNKALRAENENLQHQLDSGLVVSLEGEEDDIIITGDIDDLRGEISRLRARVKDQKAGLTKLNDHSKEQSRQVLKYKQQVEATEFMEGQFESMERMFHDLKEECGEMHKELTDAKQNLERETQMKEQLQDEVAALNAQVAVYKADFDQERQDRAEAHSRMAELEKKGARVKGQIDVEREVYHREHQDLKHNYQVLSSQLVQHQQSLLSVEEVNENLRQEIQAKASQVKQYAKENDRLKRELEQSRNRSSGKMASPTGAAGIKQSKLEDLYKTAQHDIQYYSEENSRHRDRIEMLERENEQLRRRISESAVPRTIAPYGPKPVDMNLPGQPLYADEALHGEPYVHQPVSPLTGQKQSQLAPRTIHLMADEVDADGPNPYSQGGALHPQKQHPVNLGFSPPEQESAAPQQIRPDQQEKVLAPNLQAADHHAPPLVYNPLHVAPLPQPLTPQSHQAQATPKPIQQDQPVGAQCNDQPYNQQGRLSVSDSSGGDQIPQQRADSRYHEVEDKRQLEDSTAQYENPLQKELDDEIHQQAAQVIQEVSGGRRGVKTDVQRPFDPNLVCPMCRRKFRIGEIQKFKKHVSTCTGTESDDD